jgi:hypothetical protein
MSLKCGGILLIGSIVEETTSFMLTATMLLHSGRGFCWLLRLLNLDIGGS